MIEKERLEELIEQKKSIYWKFAKIKPSSWSKYTIMGNTIVKGNLKEIYSLYDLFETKEDFEWHRQFGCIERTERLVLPTWEEVSRDLQNVLAGNYTIKEFDNVSLEYIKYRNGNYAVIGVYKYDDRLELEATKENYTLACRKAKELFLGEKE